MSELKTNLNEVSKQMDKYIKMSTTDALKQAMYLACEVVGFKSVSEHMIQTSLSEAIGLRTDPIKLTMRTGRLAGSLVDAPRFSRSELPTELESIALKSKPKTIQKLGGIQEGITSVEITPTGANAIKGTRVPYASRHEKGQGVKARPFLNPGLQDSQDEILKIIEQTIKYQGKVHNF